jgi:hypothetical protein
MGIKKTQLASTLGLGGETPAVRAGADKLNDINYDVQNKIDINNSELNTQSDDLIGSKYNKKTPYTNPEA